jgi:hypothetical protein
MSNVVVSVTLKNFKVAIATLDYQRVNPITSPLIPIEIPSNSHEIPKEYPNNPLSTL